MALMRSPATRGICGPSAAPPVAPADQIAIARVRCAGTRKIARTIESVDGISVAPATPSSARATINHSALGEKAAATDASPNAPAPIISNRRRPIRSPPGLLMMTCPKRASSGPNRMNEARIFAASLEAELIAIAGIYRTTENPLPPEVLAKPAQVRLDGEKILIEPLA